LGVFFFFSGFLLFFLSLSLYLAPSVSCSRVGSSGGEGMRLFV
jgi:hypothetical protein